MSFHCETFQVFLTWRTGPWCFDSDCKANPAPIWGRQGCPPKPQFPVLNSEYSTCLYVTPSALSVKWSHLCNCSESHSSQIPSKARYCKTFKPVPAAHAAGQEFADVFACLRVLHILLEGCCVSHTMHYSSWIIHTEMQPPLCKSLLRSFEHVGYQLSLITHWNCKRNTLKARFSIPNLSQGMKDKATAFSVPPASSELPGRDWGWRSNPATELHSHNCRLAYEESIGAPVGREACDSPEWRCLQPGWSSLEAAPAIVHTGLFLPRWLPCPQPSMQRRWASAGFSGQNTFLFVFYFWAVLQPLWWANQSIVIFYLLFWYYILFIILILF